MKSIAITDATKTRFDNLQRKLSADQNRDISQDELLVKLLDFYVNLPIPVS